MIKSVKAFGRNSEIYKRTDVEAKSRTLELTAETSLRSDNQYPTHAFTTKMDKQWAKTC